MATMGLVERKSLLHEMFFEPGQSFAPDASSGFGMIPAFSVVKEGVISSGKSPEFVVLVICLRSCFQIRNTSADALVLRRVDSKNRDVHIGNLVQRRGSAIKWHSCLDFRIANSQQPSDAAAKTESHDAHSFPADKILDL